MEIDPRKINGANAAPNRQILFKSYDHWRNPDGSHHFVVNTHLARPTTPPTVVSVGSLVVDCKDLEAAKALIMGLADAIAQQPKEIIQPPAGLKL